MRSTIQERSASERLLSEMFGTLIDEDLALQTARDLCHDWHAGLEMIHAGVALGPLMEPLAALGNNGIYETVRLLYHIRAALGRETGPECDAKWRSLMSVDDRVAPLLEQFPQTARLFPMPANPAQLPIPAGPFWSGAVLDEASPSPQNPPGTEPGSVLFLVPVELFLNPLLPVINAMHPVAPVAVLAPKQCKAWSSLRHLSSDVPILFVEDLYTPSVAEVYADWKLRARHLWDENEKRLAERLTVDGVSVWALLEPRFRGMMSRLLPHCAALVEMAQQLFMSGQPAVIITAKIVGPLETAFFAVAERCGTCRMQMPYSHNVPFASHFFFQGQVAASDRVCLWGEDYLPVFSRHLGSELTRKAIVVGNPAWDVLIDQMALPPDKQALKERIGPMLVVPPDRLWVVYLANWTNLREYPAIQAVVGEMPNAFLIVKVHPTEPMAVYEEGVLPALASRTGVVQSHPDVDLHTLLRASDIAVAYYTTAALESILAGAPLISAALDPFTRRRYPNMDWTQYGIPVAETLPALKRALLTLAEDAEARERMLAAERSGVRRLIRNLDGTRATAAVVDEIEQHRLEFRRAQSKSVS